MADNRDPEDVSEFVAEGSAYLDEVEPLLATLQERDDGGVTGADENVATIFRAFHSIKGVSGFLSFFNVQEVTHKAEEALDKVRSGKLLLERSLGGTLLETCDLLRKYFSLISRTGKDDGLIAEKSALAERLQEFNASVKAPASGGGEASVDWKAAALFAPLLTADNIARLTEAAVACLDAAEQVFIELLDAPTKLSMLGVAAEKVAALRWNAQAFGFTEAALLADAFQASLGRARPGVQVFDADEVNIYFKASMHLKAMMQRQVPEELDVTQAKIIREELQAMLAPAAAPVPAASANGRAGSEAKANETEPSGSDGAAKKTDIRVPLEKLDKMVDLIEELGVVSGSLAYSSEAWEGLEMEGFQKAAGKLKQVTEELQEVAMTIRLVPLSTVFRKMIRLVGDVSAKLGKKARLELIGEETEVDKDAMEALQDPLVHILRNSLDHGLESPSERLAAGKPEYGKVRLQAWHAGGEVCISISDDGRGILRDKVLAKAVAQGLHDPKAPVPGDREIFAYIFHPGFSLAKEVTEFSGRGVGMDVVKKNVDRLKGRIDIDSKPGQGTTFMIHLPMANALTESMLVRVGGLRYVIRVASIRETFRPEAKAITRLPDGSELVGLRGKQHRVIRLHVLHRVGGARQELTSGQLVLVENRGHHLALFVDEVLGKMQGVIKASPGMIKSARTLAGYSIIGTQSDDVAWALDINALDTVPMPADAALERG